MDALTRAIKKNKKRSSLILSLIFLLLFILILTSLGTEYSIANWISFFCNYFILLSVIWIDPKDDFPMHIYFYSKWEKDIILKIREMGFEEISRNSTRIVFKNKTKKLFPARISIRKKKEGLWRVGGKSKYIKHFEEYRVRYIHM